MKRYMLGNPQNPAVKRVQGEVLEKTVARQPTPQTEILFTGIVFVILALMIYASVRGDIAQLTVLSTALTGIVAAIAQRK